MKAKDYVKQATNDRLIVFQRDIFKDFIKQLCKEQRINVSVKFASIKDQKTCLNAPEPKF